MPQSDLAVYQAARIELLSGMGGSLMCRTIIHMLDEMSRNYGPEFDLDRAINSLERLQDIAMVTIRELKRQRRATQEREP